MPRGSRPSGWRVRCRAGWSVLVLLCASSGAVGCACLQRSPRPPCVEQSAEALIEIATGQLDDHAPHVAAWEREQARACGWVTPEDARDE